MQTLKKSIPLRSWNRIRNNGDAISAIIVDKLFEGNPFVSRADEPHLLGVGSILFMANRFSTVWGSGVLNKIAYLPPIAPNQVRALRGKLSADFMINKGILLGDIAFGDPGIFADQLIQDALTGSFGPKYRIAVVPHHDSIDHPFFDSLSRREDVCFVDILDDSLKPIQQIAQSEIVLSQSLHGLIYAESLGKPSLWISSRSDEVWNFKFDDWFSTTSNPQSEPSAMTGSIDSLIHQAERRYSTINRQELINSFPRELFNQDYSSRLSYISCRSASPVIFFLPKTYEPTVDFNLQRDLPVLTELTSNLRKITACIFRNWSERPYSIAAAIGTQSMPTPDQSKVILAAMDKRASVDFAFVIDEPNVLPAGASATELNEGVIMYSNFKALGLIIYLRPTNEPLSANFIVFSVK